MKSKWLLALLGVLAVVGVYAGTVLATPPSGQSTTTLAKAPFDPLKIKAQSDPQPLAAEAQDARDVGLLRDRQHVRGQRRNERLALASRPEPDLRYVGDDHELHVGRSPLHAAGLHRRTGVRGRGGDHVHMIKNNGSADARTIVVQFLPEGATRRIDADQPPNCG